jgi:serine/threonine-protein kinase HipA
MVLINGDLMGVVEQQQSGELAFAYERSWQERDDSYPLSLSMPLARQQHDDPVVRPFLEGLLPDNARVLDAWARTFHVSARNPFSLLAHMGEDCAGAVQFVRPDRYEAVSPAGEGEVDWLTEEGVAERLRDLVERQGTGRLAGDRGQFSLAGAQPKMPLLHDGERWGIPSGPTPTTHILKPPAQRDLDGFDINEHFCLRLAKELGLTVAESTLRSFAGQEALVVERYDRARSRDGRLIRLHQEDACQALAVSPLRKYESEGGPGPAQIVNLLLRESGEPETDVGVFVDALGFNWVIGGTDAHAKNYSLLLSPGSVRLAPLYDLISVLPYAHRLHHRHAKLAMRIDREHHLW